MSAIVGIDFRRQNLTSKAGPRTERVKESELVRLILINNIYFVTPPPSKPQNVDHAAHAGGPTTCGQRIVIAVSLINTGKK